MVSEATGLVNVMSTSRLRSAAPVFQVRDVAETMRWYEANLGFRSHPFPAEPPHVFCVLARDDVEIMLQRVNDLEKLDTYGRRSGGVWHAYLRMAGVHELYEQVRSRSGVEMLEPIKKQPYRDTEFVIRDLDGHVLVFSELIAS